MGVVGAFVPAMLTADLKRYQQPNWYIGLGFVYFLVLAGVAWASFRFADEKQYSRRWLMLAVAVLVPNICNIWIRTTFSAPGSTTLGSLFGRDGDVQLFFSYGQQFAAGIYPKNFQGQYMEYPQFALFLFWIGAKLAGKLETFVWLFPTLMLLFELGAAAALFGIGQKLKQARAAYLLAVCAATCPFLYGFAYTRFDIAPTAFLLIGVYFFLPNKNNTANAGLASAGVTAGALTKWLPAITWPFFALAYLQKRRWMQLIISTVVAAFLSLVTLVPFYLWNSTAFWYAYQYQGSRHLIGESFWFLIQDWLLDPTHAVPDKPWAEPTQILLSNNKLLVAQIVLTLLVLGLSVWRLWRIHDGSEWSRWAGAGLIGVAVFTLANRVFSPQYLVLLIWVWAAAMLLRPVNWKTLILGLAALVVTAAANFLTFLLGAYPDGWVNASAILFIVGWIFSGWLLYRLLWNKNAHITNS